MKNIKLFLFLISFSIFSQTVVSEFPLNIKHRINTKKSTGEKWISTNTREHLSNFKSKHYLLANNKSVIVTNKINKTSFIILDQNLKPIQKGSFKKHIENDLPYNIHIINDTLIASYVQIIPKSFSTKSNLTKIFHNINTNKETSYTLKDQLTSQTPLILFYFKNYLYVVTSPKSSNTLIFYKIDGQISFEKIAEANIKEIEYLTDDIDNDGYRFTIKANKTIKRTSYKSLISKHTYEQLGKTHASIKAYIDKPKNKLLLTFDNIHKNNSGTHIYSFNLDNFSRKDYSLIDYSSFNNKLEYNSVISENKLFQIGIDKNVIQLKTVDLNSKKETFHSFNKNDSLYRNNNTHYAKANFFSGKQKEKDNKSIEQFLNYTVKGEPAISSLFINDTHHLLLGSHRTIKSAYTMGGMTGGISIGFSVTTIDEFDNYTYLSINNDSINTTNNLKDSFINKLIDYDEKESNIFLKTSFEYNEEYYTGFYDALNEIYKIVRIDL